MTVSRAACFAFSAAAFFASCAAAAFATEQPTFGVGRQAFDLPEGVPLAGYSKRKGQPSAGTHDPLSVRALLIRDGQKAAALVSADLLIIDEQLAAAVEKRVASELAAPVPVLVIAATHTHSGPGAYGRRFAEKISMGHFDPAVFESIVSAIAAAVRQADQQRKPMRLACDSQDVPGVVKNRVKEDGLVDAQLSVCAVYAEAGTPEAVLVNFSAHPTTLGAWNRQLSADYPGFIAQQIEGAYPQSTVFFFAGAVGDQAPVKSGDGFERVGTVGLPLAAAALRLLKQMRPQPAGRFAVHQEWMRLPPARVRLSRRISLPRWFSRRLVDDDATLSVLVVGDAALFGVPCDLSASLGSRLKEAAASRGLNSLIAGFADDYIGYCVSPAVYASGEYEALMAFNGPGTGERITTRLVGMLDEALHP